MSTLYVDNIYSKTGTSKAIDIDSSGTVAPTARCSFFARLDTTGVASNISTVIFDNEFHDVGGDYNNTTGIFSAPEAGYYILTYSIRTNISSSGAIIHPAFFINNTQDSGSLSLVRLTSGGPFIQCAFSYVRQLASGDTVKVSCQNGTAGGTLQNGQCTFSGHLLGV